MDEKPPNPNPTESEIEALKKTTRISLEQALNVQQPPKKSTTSLLGQAGEKKSTGLITGIPTHTAPIPQTIRLKRPSTSPIVINPPDMTSAPTVVKIAHAKPPTSQVDSTATVIKKPLSSKPTNETSRIILEVEPQAPGIKKKTLPVPGISASEPTPGPKTIRLKKPSTIMTAASMEELRDIAAEVQTAKKSETSKIELPTGAAFDAPITQRKTIKIKRTDRNIIAPHKPAEQTQAKAIATTEQQIPSQEFAQDKTTPVFSILAGAAAIFLILLTYLLASQAFGPKLVFPVPSGLF